jgi:hypothetical protein
LHFFSCTIIIELINFENFNNQLDPLEDEVYNYPQGLVLVPRGADDGSVVVGSHVRGSRLRASAAGDEEVDLLLPGTATYFLWILTVVLRIFSLILLFPCRGNKVVRWYIICICLINLLTSYAFCYHHLCCIVWFEFCFLFPIVKDCIGNGEINYFPL